MYSIVSFSVTSLLNKKPVSSDSNSGSSASPVAYEKPFQTFKLENLSSISTESSASNTKFTSQSLGVVSGESVGIHSVSM